MQNALDRLVEWTDLWQLQISITKCNSRPMYVSRQPLFGVDLKIRDLSLPVNSCRDLGILVCSCLSHSPHIANQPYFAYVCNSRYCYFEICICDVRQAAAWIWQCYVVTTVCIRYSSTRKSPKAVHQTLIPLRQLGPLNSLALQSLELRRLIIDVVMRYKIVFGLTRLKMSDYFTFIPLSVSLVGTLINCLFSVQLSTPGSTTSVCVLLRQICSSERAFDRHPILNILIN